MTKYEKGQAVLLVLLGMSIILTVILSILGRSITDVTITFKEEEALRAFSAAEAGVERALQTGLYQTGSFEGASFQGSVSGIQENSATFVYPSDVPSGDSATVWFVSHDDVTEALTCSGKPCFTGSGMKVCWGTLGTSSSSLTAPAIELTVVYDTTQGGVNSGDFSSIRLARATRDPYIGGDGTRNINRFTDVTPASCTIASRNYAFSETFNLGALSIPCLGTAGCLINAKVRVLYNNTPAPLGFDVTGFGLLPSQGKRIESVGTSGDARRKIEVSKFFSELPPIFDSAVFGQGGIIK
ncbi:hypothetical protein HY008_03320 [Candidatus Woesebacteria bacterium]|nr:hypothetical protein [Candidatus Woesebacteria bacterium]